jgi:hypothetical protein
MKHGLRLDHGFEPVAVRQQDVALVGAVVAGEVAGRPPGDRMQPGTILDDQVRPADEAAGFIAMICGYLPD